jgi:signal transduction histidine kinase
MTKILVIEDHEALRNDILEILGYEGYEVRGAENGVVGVEVARAFHPDLIVCDIMMPEMDGYGVLEALRSDRRTAAIPFIFLTAKTDRADVRFGMRQGADDYVTKPFMSPELVAAIRARLARREDFVAIAEDRVKGMSESIITALPHELRTPLNTVIGFSEMLMTDASRLTTEQISEWAKHINSAGLRLLRLVENYIHFARIETTAQNPSRLAALRDHRVEPSVIVAAQSTQKALSSSRETDLTVDVEKAPGPIPISDQDLGKILEELLDNALKFSRPGSAVGVQTRVNGEYYVLQISDHGRGMTQDQINSIGAYMQFDRWYYEQQGAGLGLVIARRIAELYGGDLRIDSVVEQGTTVTVRLPLR